MKPAFSTKLWINPVNQRVIHGETLPPGYGETLPPPPFQDGETLPPSYSLIPIAKPVVASPAGVDIHQEEKTKTPGEVSPGPPLALEGKNSSSLDLPLGSFERSEDPTMKTQTRNLQPVQPSDQAPFVHCLEHSHKLPTNGSICLER